MSVWCVVVVMMAWLFVASTLADSQREGCRDCMRDPGRVWCAASCAGTSSTLFAARACEFGTCAGQARFRTQKAATLEQCERELDAVDEDGECGREDFSNNDVLVAANTTGRIIGSLSGVFCCLCIIALIVVAFNRRRHENTRVVHVVQQPQGHYVVVAPNNGGPMSPGGHPGYPGNAAHAGQLPPTAQFVQQVPAAYAPAGQFSGPVMTVSSSNASGMSAVPMPSTTASFHATPSAPELHPYGIVPDVNGQTVLHYDGAQPIHSNSNYNQRPVGK